ncbi:hypothetical protein C8R44DRAFT_725942 [Mycena epipterygia]|nr:hypothetical protein C8R44DRAFT_725942 [Mycena epipterygia]
MWEGWGGEWARYTALRKLGGDSCTDGIRMLESRGKIAAGLRHKPITCESNIGSMVNNMEETLDETTVRVIPKKGRGHMGKGSRIGWGGKRWSFGRENSRGGAESELRGMKGDASAQRAPIRDTKIGASARRARPRGTKTGTSGRRGILRGTNTGTSGRREALGGGTKADVGVREVDLCDTKACASARRIDLRGTKGGASARRMNLRDIKTGASARDEEEQGLGVSRSTGSGHKRSMRRYVGDTRSRD